MSPTFISILTFLLVHFTVLSDAQLQPSREQLSEFCKQPTSNKYAACSLMLRGGCELDASKPYCNTLALYHALCAYDNTQNTLTSICRGYTSFCTNNQAQCDVNKAWPNWANSTMMQYQVGSMCRVHNMEGCDRCRVPAPTPNSPLDDCDSLAVYAVMCKAMPDMSACAVVWKPMCNALPNSPSVFPNICTAAALSSPLPGDSAAGGGGSNPSAEFDSLPPMRMYFHQDVMDVLLFRAWFTKTAMQYWLASLGILMVSIGFTWVSKLIRSIWIPKINSQLICIHSSVTQRASENNDLAGSASSSSPVADLVHPTPSSRSVGHVLQREALIGLRSFLLVLELSYSYVLMLIVMVYSVGWIFAVLIGVWVGNCVFNRYIPNASSSTSGSNADFQRHMEDDLMVKQSICC